MKRKLLICVCALTVVISTINIIYACCQDPTSDFLVTPDDVVCAGTSFSFNASDSYDPDETELTYEWNFGDGDTGSGETVTHSYDEGGEYTVTLHVIDNDDPCCCGGGPNCEDGNDVSSQTVKVVGVESLEPDSGTEFDDGDGDPDTKSYGDSISDSGKTTDRATPKPSMPEEELPDPWTFTGGTGTRLTRTCDRTIAGITTFTCTAGTSSKQNTIYVVEAHSLEPDIGTEIDDGDGDPDTKSYVVAVSDTDVVTIIAAPYPSLSAQNLPSDWSLTGTAGTKIDNLTYTVDRTTPGVATITATCGSSSQITKIYVVEVDIIQYYDPDNGYTNIEFPLYVYKGTTVTFKAIPAPSGASWPSGKPVWGGTSGASGTGSTTSVTFNTLSSSLSDYKTVTAECGNTITANIVVFDFEGVFTPEDNFSGRHTMYYGIEEEVALSFDTDPWSVTAGQAGGLKWTKGSGSQPGTVSNVDIDYGTADYDAGATNGTVWLILTIKSGPSKGKWEGYQKDIILPSGTRMTRIDPTHVWHINNTASAGIKLYYWLDPTHVSFKNLDFGEDSCPPTPAWGVCSGIGPHAQNTFSGGIMGGNSTTGCRVQAEDHAFCIMTPWNAGDGGWTWNIPTQYIDDTSTRNTFGSTQNHVSRFWANGDATQSKGGHSGTAAAADPTQPF